MFNNNKWWILIVIVILIILIIWIARSSTPATPVENFTMEKQSAPQLDQYYIPNSDIDHLLIDKMVCSPDCCGIDKPNVYDGLTSAELHDTISSNLKLSMEYPYARTNYTCANGQNGRGCPCITKAVFNSLVNRGS